jgi:hypothetical protein
MKHPYLLFAIAGLLLFQDSNAQPVVCNPNGNIVIYSNYDGGELNINVDQNIPNLKIGIVSYEFAHINISGPFAGNVTEVRWAGYNGSNNHCNLSTPLSTTITGVPNSVDTIINYPAANYPNPNGYSSIICNYSCDNTTNQGGCNTPDQIVYYFESAFGGTLYSHHTTYGCWQGSVVRNISAGGNCCIVPTDIAKEQMIAAVSVTPNPSDDIFRLQFFAAENGQVEVLNMLGETVKSIPVTAGQLTAEISMAGEAPGIYFLRINGRSTGTRIVLAE